MANLPARRGSVGLFAGLALVFAACTGESSTESSPRVAPTLGGEGCTYDPETRTLTIQPRLRALRVTPSGRIRTAPKTCDGATVSNIDAIALVAGPRWGISLPGPALAPGFTSELDSASEIEISIQAAPTVTM